MKVRNLQTNVDKESHRYGIKHNFVLYSSFLPNSVIMHDKDKDHCMITDRVKGIAIFFHKTMEVLYNQNNTLV